MTPAREVKHRVYDLLDGIAERLSLSFAIYEPGAEWPALYRDAAATSLCGFARRAGPTSGRCRDEEAAMARAALKTGRLQRDACWRGNMRWVIPLALEGRPVLAVAVCGFGIDRDALESDYLPKEMADALGLEGSTHADRRRAFPGDSAMERPAAEVTVELLVRVLEGFVREDGAAR